MGNLEMFVFDWDRALEAIGMLVLLAFLVERVVGGYNTTIAQLRFPTRS